MKRKASEVTMEQKEAKLYKNRRHVSFSKRRSGLFSKGKDFCKKFEAEIGIVVLSEAGRPYWSPDNPFLDAVLDRFMQSDQAPTNAIDFKVRRQKKEEQDNEVLGQLAEEVKLCRTVKDMFLLRDKYLVLLQDYTNKGMKGSHVLEKGKAKCVSTSPSNLSFEDRIWVEPISRHKDICSSSTLKLDSEHDHRLGNNNGVRGGHDDGWFWDEILKDGYTQGVLMEPISKSEDVLYDSTLNFESDRNVFDTHHGNINGGEGSSWCKDWEDGKAQCALMQPILKSEEVLHNSTQNLESNRNVFTDQHGNNNDDDGTFWDRILEYDKTHQLASSEDVLFNSTPNFECDRLNNKNDGGDNNISLWDKILEESKSECVSFQPISESEDFLYNPSLNFESDNRGFDHYQGDNNGAIETMRPPLLYQCPSLALLLVIGYHLLILEWFLLK
ncbi:unnamed protein product [Prunus brigantina]